VVDGVQWDSRKELTRWRLLWARKEAGAVSQLRRQVRFALVVNGVKVCDYVADFVYVEGGKVTVEDVKSAFTRKLPVYRIKRKLMKAVYGIEIQEV
jgi:hypothetical protein